MHAEPSALMELSSQSLEEILNRVPHNYKLLSTLRDLSNVHIGKLLDELPQNVPARLRYLTLTQNEDIELSLVEWFFFGGECFDCFLLYHRPMKDETDPSEKQARTETADMWNAAYENALAKATNLARSTTQIVNGVDNRLLVKRFLRCWLDSVEPMQLWIGVWRGYKGVILAALSVYYKVAVKPEHSSVVVDQEDVRFYRKYARTIKNLVEPK
jgi:hypothetical protein